MTRETYIRRLGWCVLIFTGVSAALYAVLGSDWFGFYGVAVAALTMLPIFAAAIVKRARALGLSIIPPVLAIVVIAAAAIGQIAYWWSFFNTGAQGMSLGIVRAVLIDATATYLPYLIAILALALLWVTARGLKRSRL